VTLRTRLALVSAVAVAVAVALVSGVAYVMVENELRGEVDDGLVERADEILSSPFAARSLFDPPRFSDVPEPQLGAAGGYVQVVFHDGTTLRPPGHEVVLPVTDDVRAITSGAEEEPIFEDRTIAGTHVRILTTPVTGGAALQIARPLTEVDDVLGRLRLILVLVALAGVGVAAGLGLVVSRASLAPVRRLTETAEHITATHDLSRRVEAGGRDELSRLAASFNTMLGALQDALRAQRQLVADASHELRTPLTSLRTNVELLTRPGALSRSERVKALRDVGVQIEELAALVADVVELARDGEPQRAAEDVRLDLLVADAVDRARRHAPAVTFRTDLEECLVTGVPDRLHRAVSNVLDNAAKWSPPGTEVEVIVRAGEVTVRDHGPGIDPADMPHVFDRFYRSAAARNMPGSGLGLAIVRQVAEAHGGSVVAEPAEGGGTRVRIRIPAVITA
jgi:two-component system, OmpR family, sensor histidine kinase MprB